MKKILLLLTCIAVLVSSPAATINVFTPGNLSALVTNPNMSNLTLTGTIDARDFKYIRDNMPNLSILDMSGVTIVSYSGLGGTSYSATDTYSSNTIPVYAFCDPNTHTGKITLTSVKLPNNLTKIDRYSFSGCAQITGTLNIPSGVSSIGDEAFKDCKGFAGSLTIPASVITLGSTAFAGASGFSDVFIPATTTSIGTYCFSDTPMKIHVNAANPSFRSKDSILFNKTMTSLMSAPTSTIGKYVIPSTVTTIGSSAFQNCFLITEIVLPPALTTIGDAAFYNCAGLVQQLNFPPTLKTIGANAFSRCEGLTGSLIFPANSLTIGSSAFSGCTGFNGSLVLSDSLAVLGSHAFDGCSGFQGALVIPPKIKTIDISTFKNCSGFTSLTIPASVTTINVDAFNGCEGFMKIDDVSQIPVPILSSVFSNVDKNNCTLYVPLGKKTAYSTTPVWNEFKHIIDGFNFWVSSTNVTVAKDASSVATPTVGVTSNTIWSVSSTDSWIDFTPKTSISGDGNIIITAIEANTTPSKRIGTVVVTAPGVTPQTITVTQAIGYSTLTLSADSIMVTKEAGSKATVEVESNTDWTAVSDQPWLTVSPTSHLENGIITFTALTENTSLSPRHATVTVTASGLAPKTVVVTQSERITLYFTPSPILTNTKTYDNTTDANVILGVISGIDPAYPDVQVSISASYADIHVGKGKKINLKYKITGSDAFRYQVPNNYTALGDIEPAPLTATAVTNSRVYDGTTSAAGVPLVTGTFLGSDALSAPPTQSFEDRNAGINKQIFPDALMINDGNGGRNYKVTYLPATGTITPVTASVRALPDSRAYNGSKSSIVTPEVLGLIAPDSVNKNPVQVYTDKHVGINKKMIPSGVGINDGNNGKNYLVNYVDSLAGIITQGKLTVIALPDTKTYDRSISSNKTPIVIGFATTDTIATPAVQVFDNWNVGKNKSLIPSGIVIKDGNGGNNYSISYLNDANGTILPATLTVKAVSDIKNYDKSTSSSPTPLVSGLINPDNVSTAATQKFLDVNAGTNKIVTPSGLIVNDGNGGNNYSIDYQSDSISEIKPLPIQVTAKTDNRLYDGSTVSTKTPTITGTFIAPDAISKNPVQNYDNRNAGTDKTITPSGLIINDGAGGSNYTISYFNVVDGIITAYPLTVTAMPDSKAYDGTTNSAVIPSISGSIIAPDNIGTQPFQTFDNRKTGINKLLTPEGLVMNDGNGGNNYTTNYITINQGIITKATVLIVLTVQARADNKVYDGTDKASIKTATLSGVATGDDVKLDTVVCKFSQVNAGKDIPVAIIMSLVGADIDNYTLIQPANVKADITPKNLTVTGVTATDKMYDATTSATLKNATLVGVIGTDDVVLLQSNSGTFSQSDVGSNLAITTNMSLGGTTATNYQLTQPSGLSASITPKQTTASSPTYIFNKMYDGNTNATAIIGSLQGIEAVDNGNVTLQGITTYENPKVGNNKKMTTTFTLIGAGTSNYLPPVNDITNSGEITPKQLTATTIPNITKLKLYDGNTTAKVDTSCVIGGMIVADAGNLSVKLTANYDTPDIGNNKTIQVNYTLVGSASANYLPPVPYEVYDGRIISEIRLSPTISTTQGCDGGDFTLSYSLLAGEATKYRIRYDSTAQTNGLKNIAYSPLIGTPNTLTVAVPNGVKHGVYRGWLQLANDYGAESLEVEFECTINLSSDLIVSKFGDVVICDNSSKMFTKYQWYKNNQLITGATKQFYYDEKGLNGTYAVKVTLADGKTLITCAKSFNLSKVKKVISQPNPCKPKEVFSVLASGFNEAELNGAKLTILDINGKTVHQTQIEGSTSTVDIELPEGVYLGRITTTDGRDYSFKFMVVK